MKTFRWLALLGLDEGLVAASLTLSSIWLYRSGSAQTPDLTSDIPLTVYLFIKGFFVPFFLITAIYNFDRYWDALKDLDKPAQQNFWLTHRQTRLFVNILIPFGLAIAISAFDPRPTNSFFFTPVALLIGPVMLVAYTIRWSDLHHNPGIKRVSVERLKDIPGLKPLYLGLVWSSLAYLAADCVPWSVSPLKIGCVCALIFFRTFGDAIALDLRDIRADLANNVPTFAVMYGEKTVYYLLQFCNAIVTTIPLVCIFLGLLPAIAIGWTFHGVWACCWGQNFHWSRRQYTQGQMWMTIDQATIPLTLYFIRTLLLI